MTDVRDPAVAGRFYAGAVDDLREQLETCFGHDRGPGSVPEPVVDGPRDLFAVVSPHAGYPFSGPIAAHGFAAMARDGRPETVVLLGPAHRGAGATVSVAPHDAWATPLGTVRIDRDLRAAIVDRSSAIEPDPIAHRGEHSLEVQLPFLQYCFADAPEIVPLCYDRQDERTCRSVADAVVGALEATGRDALLVASTDLTHHEPHDVAVERDERLLEAILDHEPGTLLERVREEGHTACGPGPVATALFAAADRDATAVERYAYATSGETAGRRDEVVGYCSVGVGR